MAWLPKQTVVAPVDFSEDSFKAVDTALELVEHSANVHVVHVLPLLAVTEPGVIWDTIDDQSRREHATEALRQRFGDAPHAGVRIEVLFGDPGSEIVDYANRMQADLILLPSHGRTGIRRLLLGSVAERVVRMAHCPVLVLRQ